MTTSHSTGFSRGQLLGRGLALVLGSLALCTTLSAQNAPGGEDGGGRQRRNQAGEGGQGGPGGQRGQRGNFNPEEMQQRMSDMLRERFGVTDDEEWKLIYARIQKVNELRTSTGGMGGMMMGGRAAMGGPGGPGGQPGRGRMGGASNPELSALQVAVNDKLPDAEIKSRLARLRDTRKANEAKLAAAQEELRAVLSVRQEAVAVMAGLLP